MSSSSVAVQKEPFPLSSPASMRQPPQTPRLHADGQTCLALVRRRLDTPVRTLSLL